MITCPICRQEELNGTLFCSECGTQLIIAESPTTQHIKRPAMDLQGNAIREAGDAPGVVEAAANDQENPSVVSLHLVDHAQTIQLSNQNEYTVGRAVEGQPILPDIDLSPYDAYAQGVSRLHISLKIQPNRVSVTDLGSSNGTRINGQKIVPHVDQTVNHGDMVTLGKFAIQILIRI